MRHLVQPHVAAQALSKLKMEERVAFVSFIRSRECQEVVRRERKLSADPLSIGIAVITIFEAVSGIAVGFEAAAFVGAAVIGAAAIGVSLLLAPGGGAGQVADAPTGGFLNSQEVRQNHRLPTPVKRIPYGRILTGGDMFFEEAKAPYLYHGFMYSSRQIDGFEQARIGTDIVAILSTTGTIPVNQVIVPQGKLENGQIVGTPDYATNLRLCVRTGTSSQTIDALLDADFTSLESNFRNRGIATAVLRYRWPGSTFDTRQAMWGDQQAPNPLFLIRGVRVYDPRDPTQSRDDESTWRWSRNAALIQADYLRQEYGGKIDPDDIDYDKVAEAANYDDELVGTQAGEFIHRHTIDGVVTLNQSPNEVLKNMLTANRGFVCEAAGVFWIGSSRPREPVFTIHDGILTSGLDYQGDKPKRDLLNRVRSRFISPDREYQEVDGPLLDRTDLQTEDGQVLSTSLDLPFTSDHRTAQRLQSQFLESSRLGKSMTVRVSLTSLTKVSSELINEVVTFDSELFPEANGQYIVNAFGYADNYASVELRLSEYDIEIERSWLPSDEQPFVIADLNLS